MPDTTPQQFDDERLAARFEQLTHSLGEIKTEIDRSARLATLGTLAGMIAHEFRNLLVPVGAYAQMAIQQPQDHGLSVRAHRAALDASQRATRIADSILSLADDSIPEDQSTTVAAAFQSVYYDPNTVAIKNHIVPTDCVAIPSNDLVQVLQNLINNAIRAMNGCGTIEMYTSRTNCSTWNNIAIEVRDSGSGIDPEILDTLFEPYVSGSGGGGMGLAVCKRLIERAGGVISVSSEIGQGACFRIELPGAKPAAERHHPDGS